jgi:two-component system, chemotaxis family, chemotaxis protein CheY
VGDAGADEAAEDGAVARDGVPVVLVVEDDAATRALLRDVLEPAGYAVREAADGAPGPAGRRRAARPALVLLDLYLPGTDGWAFAAAYRRAPAPRAPVVVVTADPDAEAYAAALGAAGHLRKPFDLDALLALVRRLTARPPRRPVAGA